MQSIGTKTNQNMEDTVCQVILSKEISRPNSLCFTKNDILAVSTLLGEIILIKLLCDFITSLVRLINGQNYHSDWFKGSINCGNIYLVSGNAAPGGILRFSLTDRGMIYGAASELLKNEKCMSVESNAWQHGTLPEKRFYSLIHYEKALAFFIQTPCIMCV